MEFLEALENEMNNGDLTDNGAKSYKSTLSSSLDLFGSISASRNNLSVIDTFVKACDENLETAVRILFNSRDIRGGQGERQTFRILFCTLAHNHPQLVSKLIPLVPEYGRWDDLWHLLDTDLKDSVLNFTCAQLQNDSSSETPSLLAKWMPSCNASSKITKNQAKFFMKYLGMKEKEYRTLLSNLRKKLEVVEQKVCAKNFSKINYDKLPSRASLIHRKTFVKFDFERYSNYVSSLGCVLENRINTETLYPYDIVKNILFNDDLPDIEKNLFDAMWNNLPNFMECNKLQGLVVADTSGSMFCNDNLPISVSISLAMYIAERNSGIWKDKFLNFSQSPQMQTITGDTIFDKVRNLKDTEWGMNTDLVLVFDTILNVACENNVPQDKMPKKLIIISDMQFDQACSSNKRTNLDQIKKKYSKSGYAMPEIVFWNVNASQGSYPMKINDEGVCLVSGCSPVILKSILTDKVISPEEVMNSTVYCERYDPIGDIVKSYTN